MRLLFSFILIFSFQNILLSQKLVIPDKKWEGFYFGNPDRPFQSKFRSSKIIIDEKDYYELMYKADGGWFEGVRQYYRQEGNRVFRLYEGEEKLLFDFGLSVGDTIEISDDYGGEFKFFPIRTIDTLIFNKVLKKLEMRVKPKGNPVSNVPHVWIEGVGDVGFFFGNGYVFGNANASPLFCVREDIQFYEAGMKCPPLLTATSVKESEELNFMYDPLERKIYINIENVKRVDVYSISGELILSSIINGNINVIDVSSIRHSLCIVSILTSNSYKNKMFRL